MSKKPLKKSSEAKFYNTVSCSACVTYAVFYANVICGVPRFTDIASSQTEIICQNHDYSLVLFSSSYMGGIMEELTSPAFGIWMDGKDHLTSSRGLDLCASFRHLKMFTMNCKFTESDKCKGVRNKWPYIYFIKI
ncbi:hypothetical protein EGR_10549 [Echinococcus granulosus]|uniref:Uncharacterized protein n=1 Tax=Echinococcus granulosus TaxID=6210 RepID=W6U0F9_ECHGR|nr:hypothetical protein EGR_10549 [Echinococcus granulosus]EUB54595.1 hypothetical protein EGR_10549 [Echinococcus granulosus]